MAWTAMMVREANECMVPPFFLMEKIFIMLLLIKIIINFRNK